MLDSPGVVSAAAPLIVTVQPEAGRTVVQAAGEIDLLTAAELERPVDAALEAREPLTLDLREVAFIDSTGLRLLLETRNRAERTGTGGLVLRLDGSGRVRRLLDLTGVLHLFEIEA